MSRIMRTVASFAIMFTAGAAAAPAQDTKPITFGLGAGASLPTGPFRDRADRGYVITGSAAHRFGTTPLGLRAEILYSRYGLTDKYLGRFQGADNGDASLWGGTVDLTLNLPRVAKVRPYLLAGGGVYRRHIQVNRIDGEELVAVYDPFFGFYPEASQDEATVHARTATKFGLNGGAGITFPLARMHAFVESRYHDALTRSNRTGFVPITFGLMW
jgi:hypothetical protein